MRKSRKKTVLRCIAVIIIILLIILLAASEYMLNFALKPADNKGRNYAKELVVMKKRYPWIDDWIDSLQATGSVRDTFVVASDGDRHHALFINAPRRTSLTAVVVPGYTDGAVDMLHIGYIYNNIAVR